MCKIFLLRVLSKIWFWPGSGSRAGINWKVGSGSGSGNNLFGSDTLFAKLLFCLSAILAHLDPDPGEPNDWVGTNKYPSGSWSATPVFQGVENWFARSKSCSMNWASSWKRRSRTCLLSVRRWLGVWWRRTLPTPALSHRHLLLLSPPHSPLETKNTT